MKKKIIIGLVIVILLAGAFFTVKSLTSASADEEAVKVKTIKLKPKKLITVVDADGTVKANRERDIKAQIDGLVEEVYVEEGDIVNNNDKILQIDDDNLQQQLTEVNFDLQEVEKKYADLSAEYKDQSTIDNLQLAKAKYNLEIAQKSLLKKKLDLEDKEQELKVKLNKEKRNLDQLEEELKTKEELYKQDAVSNKELKDVKKEYQSAKEAYEQTKEKLAVLREKTIPTELQLARLKVKEAESELELQKKSNMQGQITDNDLEVAKLKVKKARSKKEELENKLTKVEVVSPIKGTVINLEVKEDDKLTAGKTVAEVASVDDLIIEAMIDEIDIGEVEVGQEVEVASEAFDEKFKGEVIKIAPAATKEGNINKFKTKIELKQGAGELRPGMFVTTEIITNNKEGVLAVPALAVLGDKDKYVYVIEDGKAVKKQIAVGLKNLEEVEVKGVKEGTEVIVGPFTKLQHLKSGTPVTKLKQTKENPEGGK